MKLKSKGAVIISALCLSVFILGATGCMSLSDSRPPGPWHEAYRPITDPASEAFVSNAFEMAVAEFGEPVIPVNTILLRRSKKAESAMRYLIGEDFSLTECPDSTNGLFVIYIGVDPGHPNYYALLGHEVMHLLNPYITDWYMEGIATVFSEQVCGEMNLEWGSWKRHFMKSRRDSYALSYRMMLELNQEFPDEYPNLIRLLQVNAKDEKWRYIDIDAWLESLPQNRQSEALDIIEPYVKGLKKGINRQYGFAVPDALQ